MTTRSPVHGGRLFFVVPSIVEENVIVPKVMKAHVDLPPVFTVVAVLAGAALPGVTRALLALPLAAALRDYLQWLVVPAIQGEKNPHPKVGPNTRREACCMSAPQSPPPPPRYSPSLCPRGPPT